jgi:nucleotide-binding universal stress UspA family protein
MYRKILVPLDGSGRAEAILPHVQSIASQFGSTVLFLVVVESGPAMIDPTDARVNNYIDELQRRAEEAKTYLTARRGEFRQMGLETNMVVMQGPVVDSIITVAENENVDLIAMASHGRTGLARVFYGSVASGVLNRVDRPLLLIRSKRDEPGR